MHIANAEFVNRLREGRLSDLRRYNKAIDRKPLWDQIISGPVDEGRTIVEA